VLYPAKGVEQSEFFSGQRRVTQLIINKTINISKWEQYSDIIYGLLCHNKICLIDMSLDKCLFKPYKILKYKSDIIYYYIVVPIVYVCSKL